MITLQPRPTLLVFATLTVIAVFPLCPPTPALAGDELGSWGILFYPVDASFASCETFDVSAISCEEITDLPIEEERPVFIWLLAYFGREAQDISEIAARICVHPAASSPEWTVCGGWSDTVVSDGDVWGRDFVPAVGECISPYVNPATEEATAPIGFWTLTYAGSMIAHSACGGAYVRYCGSDTHVVPCGCVGGRLEIQTSARGSIQNGCGCCPAVEETSWGRIKSEFER
jgi:hypothetical protein